MTSLTWQQASTQGRLARQGGPWARVRADDDLVDVTAGQHAERALVQVHDGQVRAAPVAHVLVAVQPHEQEVARRARRLPRSDRGGWAQEGSGTRVGKATAPWRLARPACPALSTDATPLLLRCSQGSSLPCDQTMYAHAVWLCAAGAALRTSLVWGDLNTFRISTWPGCSRSNAPSM